MKKIAVKYGIEVMVLVGLPFLFILADAIKKGNIKGFLFAIAILTLVSIFIFGIKYFIKENVLIIQNSVFGSTEINIHEIKKIEKTWNAISSPAPSLAGRIEIYWDKKSIVISPKDYQDFKNAMQKINSNIQFKD